MGINRNRVAPDYGIGKNGTLHPDLRRNVIERALASHSPSFVPGNDFVVAGRNLREFEVACLLGVCRVGMLRYYHVAMHANAYVAAHAFYACAGHGTRDLLPFKNKGEVV